MTTVPGIQQIGCKIWAERLPSGDIQLNAEFADDGTWCRDYFRFPRISAEDAHELAEFICNTERID
jgi:hypothetical protein